MTGVSNIQQLFLIIMLIIINSFIQQSETPLFNIRYKVKLSRTYKTITQILVKLWVCCINFNYFYQGHSLLTLYKIFMRSQLDYAIINPTISFFFEKLGSIQYNACLAITGDNSYFNRKIIPRIRLKGTVIQNEKALINYRFSVSKVS